MTCDTVILPGGQRAIVCSAGKVQKCPCGRRATLLCDWKVPGKKSGMCDKPLCWKCTTIPALDKDLCQDHARAFEEWRTSR